MLQEEEKLICVKCNVPLELKDTRFHYMNLTFNRELPRCPECGLLFIPEDLVTGRMAEVEMELEEK